MVVRRVTESEALTATLSSVKLEPGRFGLTAVECIAALLRRVAGFACPCAPSTIAGLVTDSLQGTVNWASEQLREAVESTLDGLLAYGDLLELNDYSNPASGATRRLLYAAPPSFVLRENGSAIIMGVVPDDASLLPSEMEARVEYIDCLRRIRPSAGEDLRQHLCDVGLRQRSHRSWINDPKSVSAAQFLSQNDRLLDARQSFGDVPGMTIIATTTNKNYYRGRWTVPTTQVGRFVGRRKQRYGADLWCYVQIDSGRVEKMLDLPLDVRTGGGCDEAWRLQAAIDSLAGSAQRFRRRAGGTEEVVLDFFNPLPRWVIRRWLFLARPAERRGSLLSYAFPRDEVNQEIGYLAEQLWMEEEATYAERSGDKA